MPKPQASRCSVALLGSNARGHPPGPSRRRALDFEFDARARTRVRVDRIRPWFLVVESLSQLPQPVLQPNHRMKALGPPGGGMDHLQPFAQGTRFETQILARVAEHGHKLP